MFEPGDVLRWIYGRIFRRPMNFSFIDEYIAGSSKPLHKREVDWLREKQNIGAILSVRESSLPPGWVVGLDYLSVPVRNHLPPTLEELNSCINFLIGETSLGKKAVVHCAAGRGRTGTVLAAYLCRKYGLGAEAAINQIRSERPGSIEKKQEEIIYEYCKANKEELP